MINIINYHKISISLIQYIATLIIKNHVSSLTSNTQRVFSSSVLYLPYDLNRTMKINGVKIQRNNVTPMFQNAFVILPKEQWRIGHTYTHKKKWYLGIGSRPWTYVMCLDEIVTVDRASGHTRMHCANNCSFLSIFNQCCLKQPFNISLVLRV